jgi:dephospho-CoA kinase
VNRPKIIGITGPFGSGKSTAASFFVSKGFHKITLSYFLEEELKKKGISITRKNLQDLANSWRHDEGSSILAKKAFEFVSKENLEKLVIDGIRNLGEVEYLRKVSDFTLLGLVADRNIRFERVKGLKNREKLTRELFDKLDLRDLGITEDDETGLQVAKCLSISDYFISSNDESKFLIELEKFLKKI